MLFLQNLTITGHPQSSKFQQKYLHMRNCLSVTDVASKWNVSSDPCVMFIIPRNGNFIYA